MWMKLAVSGFLVAALVALWWFFRSPQLQVASYTAPAPVAVAHKEVGDTHTYTGVIPVGSECHSLSTGVAASQGEPVYLQLRFVVYKRAGCDSAQASTTLPFSYSYTSAGSSEAPVFAGITINGETAPVVVREQ